MLDPDGILHFAGLLESTPRLTVILSILTISLHPNLIRASEKENRETLPPGSRVRIFIRYEKESVFGKVITLTPDTLVLNSEKGQLSIPLTSVARLDLNLSKQRKSGKGFLYGISLGFPLGYALSFPKCGDASGADDGPPPGCLLEPNPGKIVAITIVSGFVGAAVGSLFTSDVWKNISIEEIRVGLRPQARRGMMLSASFNF